MMENKNMVCIRVDPKFRDLLKQVKALRVGTGVDKPDEALGFVMITRLMANQYGANKPYKDKLVEVKVNKNGKS